MTDHRSGPPHRPRGTWEQARPQRSSEGHADGLAVRFCTRLPPPWPYRCSVAVRATSVYPLTTLGSTVTTATAEICEAPHEQSTQQISRRCEVTGGPLRRILHNRHQEDRRLELSNRKYGDNRSSMSCHFTFGACGGECRQTVGGQSGPALPGMTASGPVGWGMWHQHNEARSRSATHGADERVTARSRHPGPAAGRCVRRRVDAPTPPQRAARQVSAAVGP